MEITEVFYPRQRSQLRNWLKRHHSKKSEVWIRKPHKASRLPAISYDDLVEECLCFGWIDGVVKKYDDQSSVQRISPRRKRGSTLSELNGQRVWKLQHLGQMTPAGIAPITDQIGTPGDPFEIPAWISRELKRNREAWQNFQSFSIYYRRLKVFWIADTTGGKPAREVAQQRLEHLIKMSAQGKRSGTEPLAGINL